MATTPPAGTTSQSIGIAASPGFEAPPMALDAEPTERVPIDFGDLLIAVAHDLDHIRQCVGCGEDSTWAGLFLGDDGIVTATAWCDAPACENDRTVLSAGCCLAAPINHLPALRKVAAAR